jgi:hypothetical protein
MLLPNTWNDYALQYLKLTEKMLLEENEVDETVIIPVLYLARHYVELRTKMIRKISKVINGGKAKNVEGHNLEDLWTKSFNLIEEVLKKNNMYNETVKNHLNNIGDFIINQTNWDDDSMALRYPYDLKGNAYTLHINLSKFCEDWNNCMEALEYIYNSLINHIKSNTIVLSEDQINDLRNNGIDI